MNWNRVIWTFNAIMAVIVVAIFLLWWDLNHVKLPDCNSPQTGTACEGGVPL